MHTQHKKMKMKLLNKELTKLFLERLLFFSKRTTRCIVFGYRLSTHFNNVLKIEYVILFACPLIFQEESFFTYMLQDNFPTSLLNIMLLISDVCKVMDILRCE